METSEEREVWVCGSQEVGTMNFEVLALEVLTDMVDCVEQRRRAKLLAFASAPRAVAAAPSSQACLRVCMFMCSRVRGKLHQTGDLYASADKYAHSDRYS